ncbi:MAG: hypothetical protein IKH18_06915 [Clostridia bacterium]|nr:hypothetical protein [Clostridia bacterium]
MKKQEKSTVLGHKLPQKNNAGTMKKQIHSLLARSGCATMTSITGAAELQACGFLF